MGSSTCSRRQFLEAAARFSVAVTAGGSLLFDPRILPRLFHAAEEDAAARSLLDALIDQAPRGRFWISSRRPDVVCEACHEPGSADVSAGFDHRGRTMVRCELCANRCLLKPGERGECHARINVDGRLRTLVYGRPIAIHVDPIEKKPFFHFLPGSDAFSLATSGCALHCRFCQNWEISQSKPEDYRVEYTPPEAIVNRTEKHHVPIIAFTYNEPTIFTEYLLDIAHLAREEGLRSVLVSCGFMTEVPLAEMCESLDAIKIDLKGFSEQFYDKVCQAHLQPVLRSIRQVHRSGTHLELVNLVVPTLNDTEEMMRGLIRWVLDELGPDVPVHFTRFHPDYQLVNLPPTPVETLEAVWNLARDEGMHYAYVGNVPGHPGNNTWCPQCGALVIERQGFFVVGRHLDAGTCAHCGTPIAGVWS